MHLKLVDPLLWHATMAYALNIQKLNSDSRININRNTESSRWPASDIHMWGVSQTVRRRERERVAKRNRERDREGERASSIATYYRRQKQFIELFVSFFCVFAVVSLVLFVDYGIIAQAYST